ncbi:MAG: TetR/AcrR family transcriptional regulator [Deltaproteobacteria bacterium]|uniref:TetR/AcrR family transcriptional regulator n=1 Tax=Candidatus Zymogenus saltonus TaxID=2844893 RepID=A0A9D8PP86_9DELT|nr:TetR/AcrR family transcriptional regulator [Candidatus Zymogenus saltonus]
MKRRARTIEDKRAKGEKILKVAKELFFDKGYYGTTIEMITDQAGVSIGTFYFYYKNKIEIYKALQDEGLDILLEMIDGVVSRPGLSAKEKLYELAHAYLKYYREHREYFDIIAILSATPDELKETDTELSGIINTKAFNVLKKIEGVLNEGVENGEFVPLDTWKATSVFWGLMDGLVLLEERDNVVNVIGFSLDELIRQALEMSFHGIMKK